MDGKRYVKAERITEERVRFFSEGVKGVMPRKYEGHALYQLVRYAYTRGLHCGFPMGKTMIVYGYAMFGDEALLAAAKAMERAGLSEGVPLE